MIIKSFLIEQNISNLTNNIVLLYGENLGLKLDLKDKIQKSFKNSDCFNTSQDTILKNDEYFFEQINNVSLFGKEKVFFIENVNDKILDIIKEIETKNKSQKLYLFSNILDKKSKIRNYFEKSENFGISACYNDNEIGLRKIILEKLKGYIGLSAENINMIIDNCGLDRIKLNNELQKIDNFFLDKKLENDKLQVLLDLRVNDNFNILKDEALNGNKNRTNKLLSDTIIDSEKNVLYLNIINQRLSKLAETLELSKTTSLENAISMIKPPVFWKDKPKFLLQAKKWSSSKIKDILNKTYDLEILIKSNSIIDKNLLMKKLLIDICQTANA
jgi:DNA polymerase-3 subunit delta